MLNRTQNSTYEKELVALIRNESSQKLVSCASRSETATRMNIVRNTFYRKSKCIVVLSRILGYSRIALTTSIHALTLAPIHLHFVCSIWRTNCVKTFLAV